MARALAIGVLLAIAASAGALAGAAEAGVPALDPLPHASPLVPLPDSPAELTPEQRLQRQLDQQIRDAERKIEALHQKYGDLHEDRATPIDGKLDAPRKERDQAWNELQRSLHLFDDQAAHGKHDVLDTGRPTAQAAQAGPLSAINQLRIAACYQELAVGTQTAPGDLRDGAAVLEHLEPGDLPDSERPRFHYLRVWFLAEQARHSDGEQRAQQIKAAQAALSDLKQLHSDTELTAAATTLLIGLEDAGKGQAH
jgi:hypothetical protein